MTFKGGKVGPATVLQTLSHTICGFQVYSCYLIPGHFGSARGEQNKSVPGEPRKKTLITFHYTGWLIGIIIMVYHNLYIPG